MAEQARIKLSIAGERLRKSGQNESTLETRNAELICLTNCLQIAANNQKKLTDTLLCMDVIDQIENLSEDTDSIELTKHDIGLWRQGWDKSVGERPPAWLYCTKLLAQLENPNYEKENCDK